MKSLKSADQQKHNANHNQSRTAMTVREMGEMLGLRRTEWYRLVHENVFEVKTAGGQMWVDIASFEKWYANQIWYHKVTGEEPGVEVKKYTYSIDDIAQMLSIHKSSVYALIKRVSLKTVSVDFQMRVPKDDFEKWFAGQDRYQKRDPQEKDDEPTEQSISLSQMSMLLGVSGNTVQRILSDEKLSSTLQINEAAGRKRITKESFERFLDAQDTYRLVPEMAGNPILKKPEEIPPSPEPEQKGKLPEYLSVKEAAEKAGISRQAILKYANQGCFGHVRLYRNILISREDFLQWLETRA